MSSTSIIITKIGRYDIICTKGNRTYQNKHEANNVYDSYIEEHFYRYRNSTPSEKTSITQSIISALQAPTDNTSPRYRFVQTDNGKPFPQYKLLPDDKIRERVAHALRYRYKKYQGQQQQQQQIVQEQQAIVQQPRLVTDQGTLPVVVTGGTVQIPENVVDPTTNHNPHRTMCLREEADSRPITPEIVPGSPLRDEFFQILLEHYGTRTDDDDDDPLDININMYPTWQGQSYLDNPAQVHTNEYDMMDPREGLEYSTDGAYDTHDSTFHNDDDNDPFGIMEFTINDSHNNVNYDTSTTDPETLSLETSSDGEGYNGVGLNPENNESNNSNIADTIPSWLEQSSIHHVTSDGAIIFDDELHDISASISDDNDEDYDSAAQFLQENPPVSMVSNEEDYESYNSIRNNGNSDIIDGIFQTHLSQSELRTDIYGSDVIDLYADSQHNTNEILSHQSDIVVRGGTSGTLQENNSNYDETTIYSPTDEIISHPNGRVTIPNDQTQRSQESEPRLYHNVAVGGDFDIHQENIIEMIREPSLRDVDFEHYWEEEYLQIQQHPRSTVSPTQHNNNNYDERSRIVEISREIIEFFARTRMRFLRLHDIAVSVGSYETIQHYNNNYVTTVYSTVDEILSYQNDHFITPTTLSSPLYLDRRVHRSTIQPSEFLLLLPNHLTISDWDHSSIQTTATTTVVNFIITLLQLLLMVIMIQVPIRLSLYQANSSNDYGTAVTKSLVSALGYKKVARTMPKLSDRFI